MYDIRYQKEEVMRWLNSPEGTQVWVKCPKGLNEWVLDDEPLWNKDCIYIVDDEHAQVRKEWIDKGKPQLQMFYSCSNEWRDINGEPLWDIYLKFRIKPLEWYEDPEAKGKLVWVSDNPYEWWGVEIFREYDRKSKCPFKTVENGGWLYAKPVTCDELYKKKKN